MDPLAEKYPGWTPYHYVHNNPINLIDPTGMEADGWRKDLKTGEMSYCVSFTEENTDSSLYEYSDASQDSNYTYNLMDLRLLCLQGEQKQKIILRMLIPL